MKPEEHLPGAAFRRAAGRFDAALRRLNRWLALVAGIAVGAMALLITVNVLMRLGGAAIFGAEEVIQMMMVPVIFLAIGFCAQIDGHIRVDILQSILPRRAWDVIDPAVRIVVAACFCILFWRAAVVAGEAAAFGEATNLRRIPHAPVWWTLAFGAGLAALVELSLLFRKAPPHELDGDDE